MIDNWQDTFKVLLILQNFGAELVVATNVSTFSDMPRKNAILSIGDK